MLSRRSTSGVLPGVAQSKHERRGESHSPYSTACASVIPKAGLSLHYSNINVTILR